MLPVALFIASFALIFVGPSARVFMVFLWICFLVPCVNIYREALKRYWVFRQTERQYSLLALKRITILEEILRQLGRWPEYEKDLIGLVAGTTDSLLFLNSRFPDIQSMGLVSRYLTELGAIEREINGMLTQRVKDAARYLEMLDNGLINCVVPRREVPADLLGWFADSRVPTAEISRIMGEHQYSGTHPRGRQTAGPSAYTPNSYPTWHPNVSLVIGFSVGLAAFLVLFVLVMYAASSPK